MTQPLAPQRYSSRLSVIGEDTRVARALPHRARRTVGAWCFLDHAGPVQFAPGKGMHVGAHPHIGLQTFTWLIEGEVVHRDSLGNEQVIRPGQVNLMTAGRGIAHTEDSVLDGTRLHAAQLWIALPEGERRRSPAFENYPDLPVITYMPDLSWWDEHEIDDYHDAVRELLLPQTAVLVGNNTTLRHWLLPESASRRHADGQGEPLFQEAHAVVEQHGDGPDHEATLQDEGRVVGEEPGDDHLAQALGRHGRADRGGAEVDHQGQPHALEDHRQRQGQLDLEQALPLAHAHAAGGVDDVARHLAEPAQRVLEDRQKPVEKQRDQRRRRAEAHRRYRQRQHRHRRKGLADVHDGA